MGSAHVVQEACLIGENGAVKRAEERIKLRIESGVTEMAIRSVMKMMIVRVPVRIHYNHAWRPPEATRASLDIRG
jgi:hypothetical protein